MSESFCQDNRNYLQEYEIRVTEDKRIYPDEDNRLMMKASKGDKKAYAVLYNKYFSEITSFISGRDGQVQYAYNEYRQRSVQATSRDR
jgi:hypothetical protein